MNKRWIGVIASVALAVAGAFLLVRYVQGADERALEGEETVEVLVVTDPVPRGTAAEDLEAHVELTLVQVKLQTPGSVADLATLEGSYAAVDLVPGEQLLTSRFVSAEDLVALDQYPLPEGLLEITLSLSPERALGGALRPGDEVAVIASFAPFDLAAEETVNVQTEVPTDDAEGAETETISSTETRTVDTRTVSSTHLIIHMAVVTNIQVERLPTTTDAETAEESGVDLAPTGNLLVSLAMAPEDVERTIFTAEFGTVWLALETETAAGDPTQIQTRGTVYLIETNGLSQASVK
jgi:pilus assembly protein CpaB